MFRITSANATVCTLALGISACSMAPLVSQYATEYNKAYEDERNRALFLNIIRAKERRPMSHSQLQQVTAQATFGASFGATIPQGPGANSASRTFTAGLASNTGASSYSVAPLFSKKFMQGFLRPVTFSNLDYYWQQGWPKDFLLHLMVRKIELNFVRTADNGQVRPVSFDEAFANPLFFKKCGESSKEYLRLRYQTRVIGKTKEGSKGKAESHVAFENSPSAGPGWVRYAAFKCLVDSVRPYLWIARTKSPTDVGAPIHYTQIRSQELKQLVEATDGGYTLSPDEGSKCITKGTGKKTGECLRRELYQLSKPGVSREICFGKWEGRSSKFACSKPEKENPGANREQEAEGKKRDEREGTASISGKMNSLVNALGLVRPVTSQQPSGQGANNSQAGVNKPQPEDYEFEFVIHLRSVEGILYYLGQVMRAREGGKPYEVQVVWSADEKGNEYPKPLFTGQFGIAARPHVQVSFDGTNYHIPRGDDSRSMSALAVITQLLALNLEADLPPTPTTVNFVGARAVVAGQ